MTKKREEDVLLDHNYDGIQELDNDLPPWWLWMFYISIIWSVLYMAHYHVIGSGDLSSVEYEKEMNPAFTETEVSGSFSIGYSSPFYKTGEDLTPLGRVQLALAREKEAKRLVAENYGQAGQIKPGDIGFAEIVQAAMKIATPAELEKLKTAFPEIYHAYESGTSVAEAETDQSQVTEIEALTDAGSLASGESIFLTNCATCHGKLGEGGIGPNMTDGFYLHGAGINDMVKIIHTGVPAKGMIAWRGLLNEEQIIQVASYILTLEGTNPPNAKAPQGEKAN